MKIVIRGKEYTAVEAGEKAGVHESTARKRWRRIQKEGLDPELLFNNKYWYGKSGRPQNKCIQIRCPDGVERTLAEIGKMTGASRETVRARMRILKERGEPMSKLFDKARWKYKRRQPKSIPYNAEQTAPLTDEEKDALDKIPGPSDLERRIFG